MLKSNYLGILNLLSTFLHLQDISKSLSTNLLIKTHDDVGDADNSIIVRLYNTVTTLVFECEPCTSVCVIMSIAMVTVWHYTYPCTIQS